MYTTLHVLSCLLIPTLTAAISVVPEEIRMDWVSTAEPFRTDCECESGIAPDLSQRVLSLAEFPNDSCLKCYMCCLSTNLNLMNPATYELSVKELVRRVAGVDYVIATKCVNATSGLKNPSEKVYQTSLCIVFSLVQPPISIT
ncbi:hypothetical protein PPYR_09799 [Photinus pyralis]|uniref:Uncharacterized protein n=1 Tax=Photinus pyralis TaxID=7054 RepID=A0A5N4AES7_PHOPY|nr:uncharacterized protein LOC116174294 [Photinus pyralis]KAB0795738.1 hypothetical protein PPYR_09799 [Photinus pyralis]